MTVEELIEALRALPGNASTSTVVVEPFGIVTGVAYELGEVNILCEGIEPTEAEDRFTFRGMKPQGGVS